MSSCHPRNGHDPPNTLPIYDLRFSIDRAAQETVPLAQSSLVNRHSTIRNPPGGGMTITKRRHAPPAKPLRVAIGADHGGFALKATLIPFVQGLGCEVADLGTHSPKPCDYPAIGLKVASTVASGKFDRGLLLCKSGIGIAIVANKVPGIRAVACNDLFDAERSRRHNDANILELGAEKLKRQHAKRIIETWFQTPFERGGRHERRVKQIVMIEKTICGRKPVTRDQ